MTDLETILEHLPYAMLVMFRIGGLFVFAPVLGSPVIPARVKVFLAMAIGMATYAVLPPIEIQYLPADPDIWHFVPLVAIELLIGVIIGYVASLPLIAMQMGGLVMGQQMGLGFARFFNPGIDDEADILGQILFFLAIVGFLTIGGHEAMFLTVINSFNHVPVGAWVIDGEFIHLLAGLLLSMIELALRVSAPLLAIIFLETIAMGFLARSVPQLNILTLGFPVRILLGLFIVSAGITIINDIALDGITEAMQALTNWIEHTDKGAL